MSNTFGPRDLVYMLFEQADICDKLAVHLERYTNKYGVDAELQSDIERIEQQLKHLIERVEKYAQD